ncbi:MAG: hypothetical protein MET45_17320 [Nostoc sp. LLA-1]|nr:hypothetical protein [Cyanocohniella sp. LLY]
MQHLSVTLILPGIGEGMGSKNFSITFLNANGDEKTFYGISITDFSTGAIKEGEVIWHK